MILQCENLYKSYIGTQYVLNDLNLCLPKGRIIGLLGPNGCGKSTLIKTVTGLLIPTKGRVLVDGEEVGEKTKAMVSYLPEKTYLNETLRVNGLIAMFSDFYEDFDPDKARRLLSDLCIDPDAKLKTLSKGTKEKVQLIMTMSRNAKLYLLDEPIAGVDPAARDYILSTIVSNYAQGSSVVITTHLIADVEPILDDFIFFGYGGRVLMGGNADQTRMEKGKSLDQLFREVFRYAPQGF
ncbi:MAG: ABC transporter ATP-binding protein [Ruminococcaceae bacterium]|nr:ABC transporter ATP-binding protein [Oscillospiraceae bacterium]